MFKININTKDGKTYKLESEAESLIGKKLGEKVLGKDISPELDGFEFEIRGASDKAGFTSMQDVEGTMLKKVLLNYGKAMKKRPRREGKRKQLCKKPKGLRLRRSVRGNTISDAIVQINLHTIKEGKKKISEIFSEQSKTTEAPAEKSSEPAKEKPTEQPKETQEKSKEKSSEPAKEKVKKEKEQPSEKVEEKKE